MKLQADKDKFYVRATVGSTWQGLPVNCEEVLTKYGAEEIIKKINELYELVKKYETH